MQATVKVRKFRETKYPHNRSEGLTTRRSNGATKQLIREAEMAWGLFSKDDSGYESSSDSETCGHPNQTQHQETDSNGNTRTVASCSSCGMEWS